ncbi:MAG TPA: 1-(5-phosphoribosyl)-5-[(5-phosphoribosylamino)methylideneamino]imidazole-4-carboxamide isomerase [Symbiobacteriaceae bacterium]|jgi:phosphoribosylformimino-5-aminoimidazole carboxamide ribotide isomerase|nr:1-(5-phosphoribosyl)-5-[(5-phosphoribosylamino)methylideneamino]imidazole-4-carboxamide isomerase [Symbiobacteriaceae bacterium]
MRFTLYPAIDLKNGQAVRLLQGRMEDATVFNPDPANAAARWVAGGAPWLHVVDLDGAFAGASQNLPAVQAIVTTAAGVPVQLGGGLRSLEAMETALQVGVTRVIIGTKALEGALVAEAVKRFGAERVVVGIDAKNGLVATDGWVNVSSVKAVDLAARVGEAGVRTIIYTDISKDGMMAGPNFAEMAAMGRTGLSIIASGGVSSLDDIKRLMAIDGVDGAILGKAIYTGAINLEEALELCR